MAEEELEPLITECPNCSTRFRVTESQLQVASGRVRCGACLTVFHGIEFLVWDDADAYASEAEARDALDQLLDELNEDADAAKTREGEEPELADLKGVGSDPIVDPGRVAPGEFWAEDTRQFYAGHEDDTGLEDVSGDAAEPGDMGEAEQAPGQVLVESASRDTVDAVDDELAAGAVDADPDNAGLMLAPPGPVETEPDREAEDTSSDAAPEVDPELAEAGYEEEASDASVEIAASAAAPIPGHVAGGDLAGEAPADLADLPAAAEISFAPEPRRWWVGVVALLAILALAGQVFWFQFDRWGRDPAIRPAYAFVCELVGCQLPIQRDLELLKTNQLMVRSNPDMAGALVVDVVIVNQAEFAQPFPVLELRFTTIDGSLVAGRRFQPDEYLAGELATATDMEPMTPVRIELEIEDPGGDAVNYFLSFR